MCGIIGYLGEKEATPILMDSLKRLEYRGYDSAGVAVLEPGRKTSVTKSERKVDTLIEKLKENMPEGRLGIGHTRWATHGKPTVVNAHPHTDCYGRIMVVHNGIIENFAQLKVELEAAGHEFTSDHTFRVSIPSPDPSVTLNLSVANVTYSISKNPAVSPSPSP